MTAGVAGLGTSLKAGRIKYRTDKTGNIHALVGKASFEPEVLPKLLEKVWGKISVSSEDARKLIAKIRKTYTTAPLWAYNDGRGQQIFRAGNVHVPELLPGLGQGYQGHIVVHHFHAHEGAGGCLPLREDPPDARGALGVENRACRSSPSASRFPTPCSPISASASSDEGRSAGLFAQRPSMNRAKPAAKRGRSPERGSGASSTWQRSSSWTSVWAMRSGGRM